MKPAASQISSTLAASTLCSANTLRAAAISRSRVWARRAVIGGSVAGVGPTCSSFREFWVVRWIQYCIGYKSVSIAVVSEGNIRGGPTVSTYLYALGRAAYRHRVRVLLIWVAALVLIGRCRSRASAASSTRTSPSRVRSRRLALDSLNRTFPQAGGTTAQVVVVVPEGESVRDADVRRQIEAGVDGLEKIDHVDTATSPFDKYAKGVIYDDDRAAIIQLQLITVDGAVTDATFDGDRRGDRPRIQAAIPGSQVSPGGAAYSDNAPGFSHRRGPRCADRPDRAVAHPGVAPGRGDAAC